MLEILDTDPDYNCFNLDGQTIVLEDYLQIKPENRERIAKYVREGKILVGPWYQLNDEFLVSGESTVRSLLIGHRISRAFGATMKLGYLPDQFGNISQMPQIFNGFGIDTAIFGRGLQLVGDRKMEFYWESPDGSRVLSSLMAFWYNNAQHFPADTDEAVKYTETIRDVMKPVSAIDQLLFMNGVDHLEAQPDLSGILKRVNERLDGDRLMHSSLTDYMDAVKEAVERTGVELGVVKGELREDRGGSCLAGTLSSRMYLKQANEKSQTALEKYAEPVSSFAFMLGGEYQQGFLNYAWKLLMQNHPHDSICGCSIDQVHKEMVPRFEQVQQVADEITGRSLKSIADQVHTEAESLVVFNTLNWSRTDKVTATVDFYTSDPSRGCPTYDPSREVNWIRLFDDTGNEVPISFTSVLSTSKAVTDPHELPLVVLIKRFVIEFVAVDVPSCGYKTYRIEKSVSKPVYEGLNTSHIHTGSIGNEYLHLSIIRGSIQLTRCDESHGYYDSNVNTFEDVGDVGDEYLHIKPISNTTVSSGNSNSQLSMIDNNPVSTTMKMELTLLVPAEADIKHSSRSDQSVECPITSYMTVTKGVPRIDIVTEIDNRAKDHRIRVQFKTDSASRAFADGQFDVIERSAENTKEWENASPFHPQQRWVDVSNEEEKKGLCIINKGLPEYEIYTDEFTTVGLTLLRCVGNLSGGNEAPGAELTPEAQCIGKHTFEYSIYPHAGNWEEAKVWKQANQHNVPLLVHQTGEHKGCLPKAHSFLETSHDELIVSAIKKAEDCDMLVVRFYNTTDKVIENAWVRAAGTKSASLLNLNEEEIGIVDFKDSTVSMTVGAKKIVTLGFEI
jgi:alpha-mannosidase